MPNYYILKYDNVHKTIEGGYRLVVVYSRRMTLNEDGHPSRGRLRKRWMDCVKDDMKIKGVSMEMTDRREWKKKTCCADPT
jgi:hypothetical protein